MATPQSSASYDATAEKKDLEQITFRFCSECSNMLYPKEDEDAHKLQYTCRTCQYTEEASSSCVFRNILNNSSGETAGVTQDVGSDPTVSDHHSQHQHQRSCFGICLACGDVIRCRSCGIASSPLNMMEVEDTNKGNNETVEFNNDDFFAQLGGQFTLMPFENPDEDYDMGSEASETSADSTYDDFFSTPSDSDSDE